MIPVYFWGDTIPNSIYIRAIIWCYTLNGTWAVNSAAHIWGSRPYDKNINPRENLGVIFVAIGEGFHNYHHTFPWDYKTSEFPYLFNFTTCVIDLAAYFGLVSNRKVASKELVARVAEKLGDRHENCGEKFVETEMVKFENLAKKYYKEDFETYSKL